MRYLLLLLFLAACTTAPTTYRQAAPTAPQAPAFAAPGYAPAGAGLPTYIPGAARETVPRSPYSRVLPETPDTRRGPGLWSAEGPNAALRRVGGLVLLGTTLPLPVVADGLVAPGPAERCVATFHRLFLANDFNPLLKPITTEPERDCFVAKLYDLCAKTTSKAFPKDDADPAFKGLEKAVVQRTRANTNLTRQVADSFKNEKCHARSDTGPVKRAFGEVAREWMKAFPEGAI